MGLISRVSSRTYRMSDNAEEQPTDTNENKITREMTTQGMLVAQAMLMLMAVVPIWLGSKASVKDVIKAENLDPNDERLVEVEVLTKQDAMKFPITASCTLFGLYVVIKKIDPSYLNALLGGYFMLIGVYTITALLCEIPALEKLFPSIFKKEKFQLTFKQNDKTEFDWKFTYVQITYVAISTVMGVFYVYTKNWIANNIIGVALSMSAVQLMALGSFSTGAILLGGLFFYDIFWVFGTNVMVSVAKNIEAPIKVLFPTDFLEFGIFGTKHSMLGLGDIVIPGIMIALLARFDYSLGKGENRYFNCGMFAYVLGLLITMGVMNIFKHAQPALLYLVPTCVILPFLQAFIRGEVKELLAYNDAEPESEDETA